MTVTTAKKSRSTGWKRFSRNSAVVNTPARSRKGMKTQIKSVNVPTFSHSEVATQMPYTQALPIMPMKCSELMLAVMKEPPTTYQGRLRSARK